MSHLRENARSDANRASNALAVLLLALGALTAIALMTTRCAPAEGTGDLAATLIVTGAAGWLLSFLAGVYATRGGASGSLGLAVLFLVLHVIVIAASSVFASKTGTVQGMVTVHQTAQWSLMGFQSLYLLIVTWH